MKTTEPIRDRDQVNLLTGYYLKQGEIRNYILIAVTLNTALRISDVLPLKWGDVYDYEKKRFRSHITVIEKKTKKSKTIAINKKLKKALKQGVKGTSPNQYIFENARTKKPIGRVQAYRIIRAAGEAVALEKPISCHSLRKTFGYHAWNAGVALPLIMELYNHSNFAVTRRYLGISQDDMDAVYMNMAF